MKHDNRRTFLQTAAAAVLSRPALPVLGANDRINVGVVGIGGRGRDHIDGYAKLPQCRIAAVCDVDQAGRERGIAQVEKLLNYKPKQYSDMRQLFEDKEIDAVSFATPNHWHALGTIWACQAGKDVYVEKPFSYNIWEGRQMVAAARRYGRMVQTGTQRRSSTLLHEVFDYLRRGHVGPMRCVHALVYRGRDGIGRVAGPTPVPPSVDYDLWCGPAPVAPLARKQLHYDWHWFWATGNGEIGNNGAHMIDIARWALGQDLPPRRALSIGARVGFDDDAQTPNVQIALFDYQPAPLICEIRNLRAGKGRGAMGSFRSTDRGIVIDCEGGYFFGDSSGGTLYDRKGSKIKEFRDPRKPQQVEVAHVANFVAAVRDRNANALAAEAQVGHVSAICSHMANLSHRLGTATAAAEIAREHKANAELSDAFQRCSEHLRKAGVNLDKMPLAAGPWITLDAQRERFVGPYAEQAKKLSEREYRSGFEVPRLVD